MDAAEAIMARGDLRFETARAGEVPHPDGAMANWECRYGDAHGNALVLPFTGDVEPTATLVLRCMGADLADVAFAISSNPDDADEALASAWGIDVDDARETAGWLGRIRATAERVLGRDAVGTLMVRVADVPTPAPMI